MQLNLVKRQSLPHHFPSSKQNHTSATAKCCLFPRCTGSTQHPHPHPCLQDFFSHLGGLFSGTILSSAQGLSFFLPFPLPFPLGKASPSPSYLVCLSLPPLSTYLSPVFFYY